MLRIHAALGVSMMRCKKGAFMRGEHLKHAVGRCLDDGNVSRAPFADVDGFYFPV